MLSSAPQDQIVLIFDGHCGFCTWSAELVGRFDRRNRVQLVACQDTVSAQQLGISPQECEQAAWAVTPQGCQYRGAAAVNAVLDRALGLDLLLPLYRLRPIQWLQDRIYDWVVANRSCLPGVTPYCQQHPERCTSAERD